MTNSANKENIQDLTREQLLGVLEDAAQNWLAHDGSGSRPWRTLADRRGKAVQRRGDRILFGDRGQADPEAFPGCPRTGNPVLMQALRFRMYHLINKQDFVEVSATRCVFRIGSAGCSPCAGRRAPRTTPAKRPVSRNTATSRLPWTRGSKRDACPVRPMRIPKSTGVHGSSPWKSRGAHHGFAYEIGKIEEN